MKILEIFLQRLRVRVPCHCIDAGGGAFLQRQKAAAQNVDRHMMQECGQFLLSVPSDCFSYAALRL